MLPRRMHALKWLDSPAGLPVWAESGAFEDALAGGLGVKVNDFVMFVRVFAVPMTAGAIVVV